jgi:hypothetical protein
LGPGIDSKELIPPAYVAWGALFFLSVPSPHPIDFLNSSSSFFSDEIWEKTCKEIHVNGYSKKSAKIIFFTLSNGGLACGRVFSGFRDRAVLQPNTVFKKNQK